MYFTLKDSICWLPLTNTTHKEVAFVIFQKPGVVMVVDVGHSDALLLLLAGVSLTSLALDWMVDRSRVELDMVYLFRSFL